MKMLGSGPDAPRPEYPNDDSDDGGIPPPMQRAIDGFRWLGNNLHNAGSPVFDAYYRACLEDLRIALGDDWKPMDLNR
jgi:hypothetical protein